jgi:hypothetical protein
VLAANEVLARFALRRERIEFLLEPFLGIALLGRFPEIKDAMIAADWDYMAHGLYNSRPIYDYTEEQERAYWQDFITDLKEMTGKRLKGRLGGPRGRPGPRCSLCRGGDGRSLLVTCALSNLFKARRHLLRCQRA